LETYLCPAFQDKESIFKNFFGAIAQLVRASRFLSGRPGGQVVNSSFKKYGAIAQLVRASRFLSGRPGGQVVNSSFKNMAR
jgi:hypothetical protein